MASSTTVRVFDTAEQVADAAARQFVELAKVATATNDRFAVALAGGNTPRGMYELLASEEFRDRVDWTKAHIFFGDERCVAQHHPDSNYRMAEESLFSHADIPASNIHPIRGIGNPTFNAAVYESELRRFVGNASKPKLDLVLLGLGDDGHTASLFPGTSALTVTDKWVVANWVEKLAEFRITLSAPAINAAANVVFLVSGANKAPAVSAVLKGPFQPASLPAQLIKPEAGTLTWLLDSAAASRLPKD